MFSFLQAFGKAKANSLGKDLIAAIVAFDPETAGQAQLDQMREHLHETSIKLSEANQALAKERAETVERKTEYNRLLTAAEILMKQVDAEQDPLAKSKLQNSLDRHLSRTEQVHKDLADEQADEDQAAALVKDWQEAFDTLRTKLSTAKRDIATAQRDLARAEAVETRTEAQRANAEAKAGLTTALDGIDVATNAMKEAAAKKRAIAEANVRTAEAVAGTDLLEDPNIAAALAEAGAEEAPALTSQERLERLRAGTARAA